MKKVNIKLLIFCIIICELAGIIGSFFTNIDSWYYNLIKPDFNPPNWIFAPVWITLFFLMGISVYIILEKSKKKFNKGIYFFGVQLLLNILWSLFFFGLHNPLLAFVDIILLWIFILLTMIEFYKISETASYLLLPYIFWVSFAGVLNLSIYFLNL